MSALYTPGPWAWDDNLRSLRPINPDPDRSAVHTILEADGTSGFLMSDWRATESEYRADCALIAASPELIEALRQCRDYLSAIPESAAGGDDEAVRLTRLATAAIAKATGPEVAL